MRIAASASHLVVSELPAYFEIIGTLPHAVWHRAPGDSHWDTINEMTTDSLQGVFPILTLQCKRREVVPDYFESGCKPIVSAKFRVLAEQFRVAAEFIPVNMLDSGGEPAKGSPFSFMHMLEEVECVDFKQSEYETLSDRPDSLLSRVRKLVLLTDAIEDRAIFRPRRYLQIFVNDRVRDQIAMRKLRLSITPLSEVRLGC